MKKLINSVDSILEQSLAGRNEELQKANAQITAANKRLHRDLQGGRAGDQAEQLSLVLAANDLDRAGCSGGYNAVKIFHRLVEGSLAQVSLQNFGEGPR